MLIPTTVAVAIKLIVENKVKKVTFLNAVSSLAFSIMIVYFAYPVILEHIREPYVPFCIAFVVWLGEKFVTFVIYKFKIDEFLTSVVNLAWEWLTKQFK